MYVLERKLLDLSQICNKYINWAGVDAREVHVILKINPLFGQKTSKI